MWFPNMSFCCRAALVSGILMLCACGYRLQGGPGAIPPDLRRIAVPVMDNRTNEPGLEAVATKIFIEELNRRGTFDVGPTEKADAVLQGSIRRIQTSALSHGPDRHAVERRVVLTLSLELTRTASGQTLWKVEEMAFQEGYPVSTSDPVTTEFNRQAALRKILQNLAEKMEERMFVGF